MAKKILILPGDGIGQEVTSSMSEVLQYLIDEQNLDFQLSERKVGGSSFDEFGKPLTEETLDMAKNSDAILFGAVGGPQWDESWLGRPTRTSFAWVTQISWFVC